LIFDLSQFHPDKLLENTEKNRPDLGPEMIFYPSKTRISGRFGPLASPAGCARQSADFGANYGAVFWSSTMPRRSRAQREFESSSPVHLVAPAFPAELPPPPGHLSEAMQAWWRTVVHDYDLDAHHLHLLEAACDAKDRMVQARGVLRTEGLTVATRDGGKKKHPASDIERDSRLAFARLVRELDLDCEPPQEQRGWRPPPIRSNRRR
jgi:P27 family predicted phage terminase small subunit